MKDLNSTPGETLSTVDIANRAIPRCEVGIRTAAKS